MTVGSFAPVTRQVALEEAQTPRTHSFVQLKSTLRADE